MPTQDLERKIERPSKETILQAIKTLPVDPLKFQIKFSAEGITPIHEWSPSEESLKKYHSECQQKGVIPFSTMPLVYAERAGMFMPEGTLVLDYSSDGNPEENRKRVTGLLTGGRFSNITIGSKPYSHSYGYTKTAFDHLKKGFLDQISEKGYTPVSGDILLNSRTVGCCQEKGEMDDGKLSLDHQKGLTITYPSQWDSEQVASIDTWFKDLTKQQKKP